MWTDIVIVLDRVAHRGRFRPVDGTVVLEWRGGRCVEQLGALRPEVAARDSLRRCVMSSQTPRDGPLGRAWRQVRPESLDPLTDAPDRTRVVRRP